MAHHVQPDGRVHGVVAAIRREDGRWLCVRRSRHVAAPLKVCFPGGGVDAGESQEDAIVREIREELGIAVRPIVRTWTQVIPDRDLVLHGWLCVHVAGELRPDPAEIDEVLWLHSHEAVAHPDAMPSNRDFILTLDPHSVDGPLASCR
jgi:mutator protein MutT